MGESRGYQGDRHIVRTPMDALGKRATSRNSGEWVGTGRGRERHLTQGGPEIGDHREYQIHLSGGLCPIYPTIVGVAIGVTI